MDFLTDPRFAGIEPFKNKVWLSSPTMHGDEQRWVDEAIQTNWVSTVGENINAIEASFAHLIGVGRAVALSSGTAGEKATVSRAREVRHDRRNIFNSTAAVCVNSSGTPGAASPVTANSPPRTAHSAERTQIVENIFAFTVVFSGFYDSLAVCRTRRSRFASGSVRQLFGINIVCTTKKSQFPCPKKT